MNTEINVTNEIINVDTTTSVIDVNVTNEIIVIEATQGAYPLPATVYSVFGRTGDVLASFGDYSTSLVTEGTNLYYTDARARGSLSAGTGIGYSSLTGIISNTAPDQTVTLTPGSGISITGSYPSFTIASTITQYTDALARAAISLTTIGTSGAATYSPLTGVLNIPQYAPDLSGYVPTSRTLTINGTTYDLSANRSWTIDSMVYPSAGIAVSTGTAWGTSLVDNSSNWNTAYNRSIVSASVIGTTTKTLTLNEQDGSTITASWTDINTDAVTSVFGRTGAVVATEGDYTLTQLGDVAITTPSSGQVLKYNGTTWVNGTDTDTGLTSVGVSMPVAFNVANSPLIANGTISVTAAGTSNQYIRGDGQLATFPTTGGGGSLVYYYLNGSVNASVATYKQMSNTAVIGLGTDFNLIGNGLIAQFLTDTGNPNRLIIPSGAWNIEMYFSVSSVGGNQKFYVELLKYDGTTFTSITSGATNPEEITGGISTDLYITSIAVPETTLLVTDRLAMRVYVVDNSGGRTVTLHTEDNNLCQIITTFSTGVTSLDGLTANTQYLAVGTAGSDFNISSLVDTHTFNLPTASATNRGALASVDWTTFNSKVGGTGTIGQIAYWNGTSTQTGSNNLFWDSANNRLGIGTTTPSTILDLGSGTGTAGSINKIALYATIYGSYGFGVSPNQLDYISNNSHVFYNNSPSLVEVLRIDGIGNVTGNSFIKSGGTSAQILAADGSVITAGTNITISGGTISASGGGGGSISLASIGSTPNANAATLTGSVLNLEPASASFGGVVTTGTQTFAGDKTFNGKLNVYNSAGVASFFRGADGGYSAISFTGDNSGAVGSFTTAAGKINIGSRNIAGTGSNGEIVIQPHTSNILFLSTGRVGIGTITMGSSLQINGNAAIGYSASTAAPTNGLVVSGNTAIGSTTATSKFSVSNKLLMYDTTPTGADVTTIMGYTFNSNVPSGLVLEQSVQDILSFGINVSQVGTRNTSVVGGIFRLDTRTAEQRFVILGYPTGGSVAAERISVNLQNGNTYIAPIAGNTGVGLAVATTLSSKFQINGNVAIGYSASTAAPTNGLAVAGQSTFADNITISKNQNATTTIAVSNTTSGTNSLVQFNATSDSASGENSFGKYSTLKTAYKIISPKDSFYYNGTAGDFAFLNDFASGSIKFAAGASSTAHLTIASTGAATFSSSLIASSFVKSGGTSAQYLMADGSVTTGTGGTVSVTIGQAVVSGTENSILFVGPGNLLAQDNANLSWNDTTNKLNIGGDALVTGVLSQTIVTNRQTASYTLVLTDRSKLVETNVATANNLTIPLNSSVAFPIGTEINIAQYGVGQTTVVATSGVTIRSTNGWLKLNAQYAAATLIKIGTDEWYLFGNLNA